MKSDEAKAEIKDGKILIGGVDQGLEIAEYQGLRMMVTDLRKARTVHLLEGKRLDDTRIRGTGTLDGSLGIVGTDQRTKMVEVIVQAAPAGEERLDWHTYVGYSSDDEFPEDMPWAVQSRLPPDVWASLVAEFDAGRVQELRLDVDGGMWSKPTPFFHDPRPHLMLVPSGGGAGHAIAKTTSITWGTALPLREKATATPLPEAAGPDRKLLAWCLPAIVVLLAIIAMKV